MEMLLRKLLWYHHGCNPINIYGDDGELQCHECGLDFKRHSQKKIDDTIGKMNMARYMLEIGLVSKEEYDTANIRIRLNNIINKEK